MSARLRPAPGAPRSAPVGVAAAQVAPARVAAGRVAAGRLAAWSGWLLLVAGAAACSDDPSPEPAADVAAEDLGAQDATLDLVEEPDVAFDFVAPETEAQCPGGEGCTCAAAPDCDNGLCIETPTGNVCAVSCTTSCPEGFTCAAVPGKGGDVIQICVPKWGRLCEPCDASKACEEALGVEGGFCVEYGGDAGRFCGAKCGADTDCPTGWGCQAATSVEGKNAKQCVRLPETDGQVQCPCSARATALQLTTQCQVQGDLGTCPGSRGCGADGLSACSAPEAATETCNGQDDDCNGKTDDVVCDDEDPCTDDACDAGTATCTHTPNTAPCADGNPCTEKDACDATSGKCGGTAVDCDDGSPCTLDNCDPAVGSPGSGGCVYQPVGGACDDGNPCTVNDACVTPEAGNPNSGKCEGGGAKDCNDNEPCTADQCDPATGCKNPPQPGTCEDGNPCTNGDVCAAGKCTPGENVCACVQDADCALKDDADLCNGTLYCDKGTAPFVCKTDPKTVVACDKAADTACSQNQCDAKTGTCAQVAAPDGKACDADGSVCTAGDTCAVGLCAAGTVITCDDANPCTDDGCDAKTGCTKTNNIGPCSDGNACTVADTCGGGLCVAGAKTVCDDGSPCTIDSCDTATGKCKFDGAPFEGDPCDADGSVCTVGDKCLDAKCKAGTTKNCDDQNPCTLDECDAKAGCVHLNNALPCDFDGSPCTPNDVCKNGNCAPGPKKDCDDGNACTIDFCDQNTGACQHAGGPLEGAACDDGSKCTDANTCLQGQCSAGKPISCDDGKQCTADSCEALKGCLHQDLDGPCNDGDSCTKSDVCVAGTCKGIQLQCDDANPCTVEGCDAVQGCTHTNAQDGSTCDVGKHCVAGKCVVPGCGDGYVQPAKPGETSEQCDDGNANACDGCAQCVLLHHLVLDGKGYGTAAVTPGPAGTLQGELELDQDLTLEAWVKPATAAVEQPVVSKSAVAGLGSWTLGLLAASGKLYFTHKGPEGAEFVVGDTAAPVGKWSHVAVSIAGDRVRLFVDGKPAGAAKLVKARVASPGVPVAVGRRHADDGAVAFQGALDAVHLAAAPLYGGGFVPARRPQAVPATRALWHFDAGQGDSVPDAGPHANVLKLQGAAFGKDDCYGAAADAAVCGDGKIAPAFEACDDGNGQLCDGCEGCQTRKTLNVGGQALVQSKAVSTWAPDAFCPTCDGTVEAWVRLDQPQPVQEIFGTSCGSLSVNVAQGKFGLYRYPEPLCQGTTTLTPGKWYHVAATFGWAKGAEFRLYVDGKLECAKTSTLGAGPVDPDKEVLFAGAGAGGVGGDCAVPKAGNHWPGLVDEVRVSQGQRYTDDFTPGRRVVADAQTRGLWHLDDGATPIAEDSGAALQTTVTNATWSADVCYGDLAAAAACGDSQKAKWETCDSGAANGPWPKQCSGVCTANLPGDCSGIEWPAGKVPLAKNTMTYPVAGWTVEGWVRLPAYPTGATHGAITGVGSEDGCPLHPVGQAWRVAVTADGTDASHLGGTTQQSSKARRVWKLNTWQHFALQYHGLGKGSLYVDGAKVRDFSNVSASWSATCPMLLGDAPTASPFTAGARLASLRMSKKVRYGEPFAPKWTLPADGATGFLFDFAEGAGTTSKDATQTFSFDLKGATWTKSGPGCP